MRRSIWAVLAVIVLVALALVAAGEVYTWFVPGHLRRSELWSSPGGVYWVDRSESPVLYRLPGRNRGCVKLPIFSACTNLLVYCPREGRYLGIAHAYGEPLLVDLPKQFTGDDWTVASLSTDGRVVAMNMARDYRPRAVLLFDILHHQWTTMDDTVQATVDPAGSSRMCRQSASGIVTVTASRDTKTRTTTRQVVSLKPLISDEARGLGSWTYDFATDTLYVVKSHKEILVKSVDGKTSIYRLPRRYMAEGVIWASSLDELWVPVRAAFSQTGVAVFSEHGQYLGAHDSNLGGYGYMGVATPNATRLLSDISRRR